MYTYRSRTTSQAGSLHGPILQTVGYWPDYSLTNENPRKARLCACQSLVEPQLGALPRGGPMTRTVRVTSHPRTDRRVADREEASPRCAITSGLPRYADQPLMTAHSWSQGSGKSASHHPSVGSRALAGGHAIVSSCDDRNAQAGRSGRPSSGPRPLRARAWDRRLLADGVTTICETTSPKQSSTPPA
jgi:hypothetical protein